MNHSSLAEITDYGSKGSNSSSEVPTLPDLKPYSEMDMQNETQGQYNSNESQETVLSFRDIQKLKTPRLPRLIEKREPSFKTVSRWECEVVEFTDEENFIAKVISPDSEKKSGKDIEDYIEFSLSEVNPEDRKLLQEGALFYWHVGYEYTPKGQVKNTSLLILRRMPVWKNVEQKAKKKADKFKRLIEQHSK